MPKLFFMRPSGGSASAQVNYAPGTDYVIITGPRNVHSISYTTDGGATEIMLNPATDLPHNTGAKQVLVSIKGLPQVFEKPVAPVVPTLALALSGPLTPGSTVTLTATITGATVSDLTSASLSVGGVAVVLSGTGLTRTGTIPADAVAGAVIAAMASATAGGQTISGSATGEVAAESVVITDVAGMVAAQKTSFVAAHDTTAGGTRIALPHLLNLEGDSTVQNVRNSDNVADRTGPELRMRNFLSSPVNNYALGGATLANILADFGTAPQSGQLDATWFIQGGINSSGEVAQNLSNWTSIFGLFAHQRLAYIPPTKAEGTTLLTSPGLNVTIQTKHLLDNANGFVWDRWSMVAEQVVAAGNVTASDRNNLATGGHPADYIGVPNSTDNIHYGPAMLEPWSIHMTQIGRALDDPAYPYVQTQQLNAHPAMVAGAVIGTVSAIGNLAAVEILSGNADGLVAISNTGVVTRGTGAWGLADFREVFIRYRGTGNEWQYARLVLARWGADEVGVGVRFAAPTGVTPNTSLVARTVGDYPEFSLIVRGNHKSTTISNLLSSVGGTGTLISAVNDGATNMRVRMTLRSAAGVQINPSQINTPNAPSPSAMAWWLLSYRAADGVIRFGTNNTVQSQTASTLGVPLSFLQGIGVLPVGNAALECVWAAPAFIDWSVASERARFFDASTLAPVAIGAGVVNGITPDVYLHGGPGGYTGWVPPLNQHCALDLYGTPWVGHDYTDVRAA